jgi:hypothetical protein
MMSLNINDKLMALKSIERIIQLCGQNIRNDGWRVIIINVGKASEIGEQQSFIMGATESKQQVSGASSDLVRYEQLVLQNGFKCLKLIISNYIQSLGQDNFVSIFTCIQRFAQSDNENINSNLTAIAMFMNVADYTAKLTRELNEKKVNVRKSQVSSTS